LRGEGSSKGAAFGPEGAEMRNRNKIIFAIIFILSVFILALLGPPRFGGVRDILKATVLIIIGYPIILAFEWLSASMCLIQIFIFLAFYVIIRAIIGLFIKDKYAKWYRILAVIAWGIGGWFMYMLQWT
jgi:hypothetical protein